MNYGVKFIVSINTFVRRVSDYKMIRIFFCLKKKVTSARELLSKQTRVSRIGLNDEADVKNISYRTKTTASPHIIYVRHMKARIQPINRDYRLTDDPVFHQIYSSRDHVFSSTHNITRVCVRCELAHVISISPFRNRVFDEFYTKVQKKYIYSTPPRSLITNLFCSHNPTATRYNDNHATLPLTSVLYKLFIFIQIYFFLTLITNLFPVTSCIAHCVHIIICMYTSSCLKTLLVKIEAKKKFIINSI